MLQRGHCDAANVSGAGPSRARRFPAAFSTLLQLEMRSASNNVWTIVVEDAEGSLVACGSIFVELKFTHECGKVGHIEDIVVSRCACERCRPAIHLRDIS